MINERLDIDNYQGVKVMDINVRPLNQNVAQIRAQKELSSMHSQQKLGSSSIGDIATTHAVPNMAAQNISITNVGASAGVGSTHHHQEGASRILSAETLNERQQKRMITDVLNEIITTKTAKETGSGINQMRFENDLVTTFFDKIEKLNEEFTYSFVNDLKTHVTSVLDPLERRAPAVPLPRRQRTGYLLHLPANDAAEAAADLLLVHKHPALLQAACEAGE